MGLAGIGSALGAAVGGFEQARQIDLQRQFEGEQSRRAQFMSLLGQLAQNPNAHPYTQQQALQMGIELAKTPLNKTWKMDPERLLTPPELQQKLPMQQVTTPGNMALPMPTPPGATGTPEQQLPIRSMPIPQPPLTAQFQPQPQPSMIMTPEQAAQRIGTLTSAETGGQLRGQIGAREEYLQNIPGLNPEERAMFGLGINPYMYMRAMNQPIGMGQGVPGADLLQQYPQEAQTAGVRPDQFYNVRELAGGRRTFELTKGPGEVAGPGGTLLTPGERQQQKQQLELPYVAKVMGMRFANSLALQNHAFQLGLQRHDYGLTDQLTAKAFQDLTQRRGALRIMQENYQDALKGNQQAQVSMLFNHIGMTSGAVPGSRQSRATIEEAEKSTPWVKGMIAKWFHQDENGDYVFDGLKGGINLNQQQMDQMIELAGQRVAIQQGVVKAYEDAPFSGELKFPGMESIGATPTRGGGAHTAKPAKLGAPPKPPSAEKKAADNDPLGIR